MKKRINITIDELTLNCLDELANKRGISRSAMITLMARFNYYKEQYPNDFIDLDSFHILQE